MERNQKRTIV